MLGLLAGFRWFDKPRFMGAQRPQSSEVAAASTSWAGATSGSAISGASCWRSASVALAIRGLNLGIDFKGGTQITFTTPRPHHDRRRARAPQARSGRATPSIQGRGQRTSGDQYKSFQVRTESLVDGPSRTSSTNALEQRFEATAFGATNVSSSFGRQIAKDAHPRDLLLALPGRPLHRDPVRDQVRASR